MGGVKAPDEGLIPIPMMGAHLLTLFEQLHRPSFCIIEDFADLFSGSSATSGVSVLVCKDLGKHVNQAFGGSAILFCVTAPTLLWLSWSACSIRF